mmetsp:Transcript_13167/g.22660  ORF Transcript_13167/g.22660 Transcript_13167/m.22660 type:complete len:212 (-) Transcript_13167:359-994(-)
MATTTTGSPLKHDVHGRTKRGQLKNIADSLLGARLEANEVNSSALEAVEDIFSLFLCRHTSTNSDGLDWETSLCEFTDERKLKAPLVRVKIQHVDGHTDARVELACELLDLHFEEIRGREASGSELCVVASIGAGCDEIDAVEGGGGRHARHHYRCTSNRAGVLGHKDALAITGTHSDFGRELLTPRSCDRDALGLLRSEDGCQRLRARAA